MKKKKLVSIEKENYNDKKHIISKIIVNLITGIRSLGTIAIIPIFLNCSGLITALASAIFLATDCIDGFLARKLHVQTFFGSLLDALSDKAFGVVCMCLLATQNPLFLAVIALEAGIFTINYQSVKRGNNTKTSQKGRMKTVLLSASIVGSILAYGFPDLKELLNYINVTSFNFILEKDPNLISTILAIPAIGADIIVASDYLKTAKRHDEERQKLEKVNKRLEEINNEKEKLKKQKKEIEQLKSPKELAHILFDTEYYLEHKDDEIKKLIYKRS